MLCGAVGYVDCLPPGALIHRFAGPLLPVPSVGSWSLSLLDDGENSIIEDENGDD